jgi:RNA polymerase sigma-70 factor (ECF subfamily)
MRDEASLDARWRAGDGGAFAELVQEHSPRIYGLALRMMQDPAEAEDVLQETFLQAAQHLKDFRGQANLGTWLYRIATNQALMRLRRRRPLATSLDEAAEAHVEVVLGTPDWSSRPESELLSSEARAQMERAITALPDSLRFVFILRDIEGRSTVETAEALELSVSAVKSRLNLRNKLSAYFAERSKPGEARCNEE